MYRGYCFTRDNVQLPYVTIPSRKGILNYLNLHRHAFHKILVRNAMDVIVAEVRNHQIYALEDISNPKQDDFPECVGCKFNIRWGTDNYVCCYQEQMAKEALERRKTKCPGIQKRVWSA